MYCEYTCKFKDLVAFNYVYTYMYMYGHHRIVTMYRLEHTHTCIIMY